MINPDFKIKNLYDKIRDLEKENDELKAKIAFYEKQMCELLKIGVIL